MDHHDPICPSDLSKVNTDDLDDHFEMPFDIKQAIKHNPPLARKLLMLRDEPKRPTLRRVK